MTGECLENRLRCRHTAEVDRGQHCRKRAVDEGAVYEQVYVVEAIAENGYPYSDGNGWYRGYVKHKPGPVEPEWCVYHPGDNVCKSLAANVCSSSVNEPLDLLTFHSYGTTQSHKQR